MNRTHPWFPPHPRSFPAGQPLFLGLLLAVALATSLAGCRGVEGETADAMSSSEPYPAAVLTPLRESLGTYEKVRAALAADNLYAVEDPSLRLARSYRRAEEAAGEGPTAQLAGEAAAAAESLGASSDLETARAAFAEVSRFMTALAAADERLSKDLHVFACPMVKGFNKWLQPSEELENPFMGQAMPSCGTPADWEVEMPSTIEEVEAHAEHVHGGDAAYYTCSMHPSVKNEGPGTCPICSMDLVPVTREEIETGTILVDAARRQAIGVTTAPAERRRLETSLRAVGSVVYDETRLAEVTVKYRGWIGELLVDEPGQEVRRGQTLFTLYSPELYATQEEFLSALDSQRAARDTSAPRRADYLVEAARKRMHLWDLQEWQIEQVAETGEPVEYLPIVSPVSGHVVAKNVVQGSTVQPGATLYRIAGLDSVWVEAELYESELPRVEVGQTARVTLPYLPGRSFEGQVAFVYPFLDGTRRTGRIRVELANPDLALKPDMFAHVVLETDMGQRLVVPEEAVLYAGERSFVFVDLGEGRLRPTAIETGVKTADFVEVLSGLEEGEPVVTSGNFLVAAESRLKLAMEHWQ